MDRMKRNIKVKRVKKNIRKTKNKNKKVKAFHQKVKVFRSNDPKLSVIMWGVNHSMSQMIHVPVPVMLMKDDFKAFSKIKIDNHLYNKENMPSHFKFKEYMPLVFRNLRIRFDIDEGVYARSLMVEPRESVDQGKSGSKFLTTNDRRFYIKSIEREEVEMMHSIMPKYHQYVVEAHSSTLLPQYVAMYRTTVDGKEYYYLVCRSVFSNKCKIHKKFDLKGSSIDREAKEAEKDKEFPTFKDNDFTNEGIKLNIGEHRDQFIAKLNRDVEFLTSLNIMDYSLLIGIHDRTRQDLYVEDEDEIDDEDEDSSEDNIDGDEDDDDYGGDDSAGEQGSPVEEGDETDCACNVYFTSRMLSVDEEEKFNPDAYCIEGTDENKFVYYMGIIDVLTYYGATKKAAHAAKTVKHGANADISTVKPQQYAQRFLEFIQSVLE